MTRFGLLAVLLATAHSFNFVGKVQQSVLSDAADIEGVKAGR
jgi:hypothetical protein